MRRTGLDATDIRILSAVQAHGPLSKTALAGIVNLSPTPCRDRLNRLRAAGLIRGYRAEIALERVCDVTMVIVTVALMHHRKADFDRFEAQVRARNEIAECVATGGGMDYVMQVFCPSLTAFQALMDALLDAEIGIDRYMTYIATRKVKSQPPDLVMLCGTGRGAQAAG